MGNKSETVQDVAIMIGTFSSCFFLPGRLSLPILDHVLQSSDFEEYPRDEYLMFHEMAQIWDGVRSVGLLAAALSSELIFQNHDLSLLAGISSLVFAGSLLALRKMNVEEE